MAGPEPGTGALAALDDDELPPEPPPLRSWRVPREASGERLDKALAGLMPEVSRSRLQRWIEAGAVRVNGRAGRVRDAVYRDDTIEVEPQPAPQEGAHAAEAMPLAVVWEDESLIVIDKPPGLVVHPGAGNWNGTLLNGLLAHDPGLAAVPRAGIVHRLDAGTSGLLVVARSLAAQLDLVRQLQERSVTREYWALVAGTAPPAGTIDAALARDPRNPLRFRVSRAAGAREARTHYRRLASASLPAATRASGAAALSWVACRLETGRTHQIRVHLESIGHPLLGDPVYRRGLPAALAAPAGLARQALHACRLGLRHPVSGAALGWFRPPPADLAACMDACGLAGYQQAIEAFG